MLCLSKGEQRPPKIRILGTVLRRSSRDTGRERKEENSKTQPDKSQIFITATCKQPKLIKRGIRRN